jgi:enoyl-CoA hydratase/carnithine racemase
MTEGDRMPEQRYVEVRRAGTTCIVTLRREEKLNTLSSQVERELRTAIESEEARQSRCLVITGGARAFSAGADVGEMRGMDPASILAYYRDSGDVYERIAALGQPTISAISGYCLGGGLELALATDFRIAAESAVLGLPEVSIGIVPSSGGIHRLVRMVGTARAREWILLGRRFSARDALAAGIVTEVVAEEAVLPRALEIAAELATLPPLAIEVAKLSIDRGSESSREAALAIERLAYGLLAQSEDAREALAAFMDKREPRFQGR